MAKPIVTISRQFGSGGRLIGQILAEKLGVEYYDKKILDDIAEEYGYSVEMIEEDKRKAKNGFFYSLSNAFGAAGYGPDTLSINEKFFIAQFDYITEVANKGEGAVFVGRCSSYVLREFDNVTNVFVYADQESKRKRAIEEYGAEADNIDKMMAEVDRARSNYYKYHTGQKWGDLMNYHISMDSSCLSMEDYANVIYEYVKLRNK